MKKLLQISIILLLLVMLGACENNGLQKSDSLQDHGSYNVASSKIESNQPLVWVTFPAYELENSDGQQSIDHANRKQKFVVYANVPKNWTLKKSKGDETVPAGEFSTPLYIYDEEKLIGYIGFNYFEPYPNEDEVPKGEYYKTVYPTLRLSSMFSWDPYTAVTETDTGETGIANIWYLDPNEIDQHPGAMADVPALKTLGILSYDKELEAFIGIAFMPDAIDPADVEAIAKSIRLTAFNETE